MAPTGGDEEPIRPAEAILTDETRDPVFVALVIRGRAWNGIDETGPLLLDPKRHAVRGALAAARPEAVVGAIVELGFPPLAVIGKAVDVFERRLGERCAKNMFPAAIQQTELPLHSPIQLVRNGEITTIDCDT